MKRAGGRPHLKVLFTTGYARNAIVHDGRLDAGVDLITKPYSQSALAEKLRDILDAKRDPGRILLARGVRRSSRCLPLNTWREVALPFMPPRTASEAMNVLGKIPGGVDAVVVDMGLPDRRGDALIAEIKAFTLLWLKQRFEGVDDAFEANASHRDEVRLKLNRPAIIFLPQVPVPGKAYSFWLVCP